MPAPFAASLCKYRAKTSKPNTSDASDKLSVEIGEALFEILGVSKEAKGDEPTGGVMAKEVVADLKRRVGVIDTDIDVVPERKLNQFEQFAHVGVLSGIKPGRSKAFNREWARIARFTKRRLHESADQQKFDEYAGSLLAVLDGEGDDLQKLVDQMGGESLLGLDITASRPSKTGLPLLEMGLSLKWSLRTDRAQDCRSQGAKMSALRRGRMPHFAAVTMEPRPYMLNLLGGGSGDVDCVYHLDLPALAQAVDSVYTSPQRMKGRDTFHRLVEQRRLRDYDDLVAEVSAL